jgi:hypothetical protein
MIDPGFSYDPHVAKALIACGAALFVALFGLLIGRPPRRLPPGEYKLR